MAGFLRAWEALRDEKYLTIGAQLLDYWWQQTDSSRIPPWDFKDPVLDIDPESVPVDTSAAAIVAEQLARLAILPDLEPDAQEIAARVTPMIDGLIGHLTLPGDSSGHPPGILRSGCFNRPKNYATHSELIWGDAYLMFALYYLKTGRVVE